MKTLTAKIEVIEHQRSSGARYLIIDALRFVLAFWVVMGHNGGLPPLFVSLDSSRIGHLLSKAWGTGVFGTPAVIGFFVISGFCIHLPFSNREDMPVLRFYLRRYTRILVPVLAVLVLYKLVSGKVEFSGEHSILWNSTLWSIACEEIYYASYPLLRMARHKFGWAPLLTASFAASQVVTLSHRGAREWIELGPFLTALILLPVWLLGCLLAEQSGRLPQISSSREIWLWRGIAWGASWACEMLHFHAGIAQTLTSAWFGIIFYWWIRKEIQYGKYKSPNRLLVLGGAWSYSLYLIHPPIIDYFWLHHLANFASLPYWFLSTLAVLAGSYVFALLIEFPSHRLARKISLRRRVPVVTLSSETAA
jgi:peptidoglycan/LPS O-acetylase OafA/YrhL